MDEICHARKCREAVGWIAVLLSASISNE